MKTSLSRTAAVVATTLAAALALPAASAAQTDCDLVCNQPYALCIAATCAVTPSGEAALCACTVESGYSIGPTGCAERSPVQGGGFTLLTSTFSTALYATAPFSSGSGPSADCYGSPCLTLDGEDAVCMCRVSSGGGAYWTEAGACSAPQTGFVYSGASSPFDGGLAGLAQQLAKCSGTTAPSPTSCPSGAAE